MHRRAAALWSTFLWALLLVLSLSAGILGFVYFPRALPLLSLSITMNKQQALCQAQAAAQQYKLGPEQYRQVAYFNHDQLAQHYIELKAGGLTSLQRLLSSSAYALYTWQVRHFSPGVRNEVTIKFTPQGKLYGFIETVSENQPGVQLSLEQAKEKARDFMHAWAVPEEYQLIDTAYQDMPSGRRDYTLVYQRSDIQLGQAHYRLKLIVSGDKISMFNYSIDIPDSFVQEYQEMRSSNEALAALAKALLYVLYFFGGCLVGIALLIKRHALWPQPAFFAAFTIATVQLLIEFNQAELMWLCYDTALTTRAFWFDYILRLLGFYCTWVAFYTTIFMAAEGLTRRAFGHHLQLWRLWQPSVAATYTMLQRTIGGYLLIGFDFAFVVVFYMFGSKLYGWWSPASALTDPNILSSYSPALAILGRALAAGFWEECMFRAIPLSVSALIGQKLGFRRPALLLGLLVQAIIFGAAHAHYPTFPAYVRVIELIIPSLGFGIIYLLFGLLPVILAHAVYDAILFAIPLFITQAPGLGLQKLLVIIGCLVPLLVIFIQRLRAKSWLPIMPSAYNNTWQTSFVDALPSQATACIAVPTGIYTVSTRTLRQYILLGATCCAIWFISHNTDNKSLFSLKLTRNQAITCAYKALADQNVTLGKQWRVFATVCTQGEQEKLFVWQQSANAYYKLLGSYLPIPLWNIRFARFTGSLFERAQEYQVLINNQGQASSIIHYLPEEYPGATLTKEQAQKKVQAHIYSKYAIAPDQLHEIAAVGTKQPHRQDWTFTYRVPLPPELIQLSSIQPRIQVTLAGDRILASSRYIHLPEDWLQAQKRLDLITHLFSLISTVCFFIILALAARRAFPAWQQDRFALGPAFVLSLCLTLYGVASTLTNLPEITACFTTAQPFFAQLLMQATARIIALSMEFFLFILLLGTLLSRRQYSYLLTSGYTVLLGSIAGITVAVFMGMFKKLLFSLPPDMPLYTGASSFLPWLVYAGQVIFSYIKYTYALSILALEAQESNSIFKKLLLALVAAGLITPFMWGTNALSWLCFLLLITATVVFINRTSIYYDISLLPIATAAATLMSVSIQAGAYAYPTVAQGILMASIGCIFLAWIHYRLFRQNSC